MTTQLERIQNEIDHYVDSIRAIVGLINFYRFDETKKRMRDDVRFYQGLRLKPETHSETESAELVTPDIGIIEDFKRAVLAEVKIAFPKDKTLWKDDFRQLMDYDRTFVNWPPEVGSVKTHEIVLLLHQSRSRDVLKFMDESVEKGEIKFGHPFIVVEFSRSDNREPYFFFRVERGALSNATVQATLFSGKMVPMRIFTDIYSTVKLYDAEPPTPYLAYLIWEHVVNREAKDDLKYHKLRWNQKISVHVNVDEIVNTLDTAFSFRSIQDFETKSQPKTPQTQWVKRACDFMVGIGDAEWQGESKIKFNFKLLKDTKAYFVEKYHPPGVDVEQLSMFNEAK